MVVRSKYKAKLLKLSPGAYRVLITRYIQDQSCLLPAKSLLLYILVRKMKKKK